MKTAAAYVRVSTDDQLEYSPDSQLKIIYEYAKNHDIILPEEFIFTESDGISGRKAEKRPAFMKMIGTAKKKPRPFDIILVWKFSRFARSREDSVVYKSMLRKDCGIDVISINEQLSDDKTSILIEALIEAMDEYYSINLAEEVKRGMKEKASRGGILTGAPFGYNVKNGNYVINPNESSIVQMIFTDFLKGLSYREIACKLNEMKIYSKRGNKFESRTVEYILQNPVYIGKIRWNPTEPTHRDYDHPDIIIANGKHTSIIDDNIWEQTQLRIDAIKKMYSKFSKHHVNHEFILRGLIKCSNCGSTLVLNSKTNGLQCHAYSSGKCSESHFISLATITESVLNLIEKLLAAENFDLIIKPEPNENPEANILISKQYTMLKRAKSAYLCGIDTLEEYQTNKEKIKFEIKRLKSKHTKKSPEILRKNFIKENKNLTKKLRSNEFTDTQKNQLLRTCIDKIIFDRKNNSLKILFYI